MPESTSNIKHSKHFSSMEPSRNVFDCRQGIILLLQSSTDRLQNSRIFCEREQRDHIRTKGLERVKKRRGGMVRDAKKYGCPLCIYQIRSELPVLPATGNSHWSNRDAICHQIAITPHQKYIEFHWKDRFSRENERC